MAAFTVPDAISSPGNSDETPHMERMRDERYETWEAMMARAKRSLAATGGLLIIISVLLAVLPQDWIEETFGVEPDAGSGALELALVLVPAALGLSLVASAYLSHRHERDERTRAKESTT
jgi:hypothetical protein